MRIFVKNTPFINNFRRIFIKGLNFAPPRPAKCVTVPQNSTGSKYPNQCFFLQAFNVWMKIPEDKLNLLASVMDTLHNASLL